MSSRCLTPFPRRHKITGEWMALPCGKCPNCLKRRTSGWSFRLMKEGDISETALFVTLTYESSYVPISENGFMTLEKSAVQLFMKRLRKDSDKKLKYYAIGEYGGKRNRPHYHLILFNADAEKVEKAWSYYSPGGRRISLGNVYIGSVTGASIGYVLKYMQKLPRKKLHERDDRIKEFSLMSKGLGANYVTDAMKKWHHNALLDRMYVPMKDNKKIAMPRYYKDRVYSETQKLQITNHFKKVMPEKFEEEYQKLKDEHGELHGKVYFEQVEQLFRRMYNDSQLGRDKIEKHEDKKLIKRKFFSKEL
jgi:hypothetical protein